MVCPVAGPVVAAVPFGSPGLEPPPATGGDGPLPLIEVVPFVAPAPVLLDLGSPPSPLSEVPEWAGGEIVNGTTVAAPDAGGCGGNTVVPAPFIWAASALAMAAATAARRALKNCSSAKLALFVSLEGEEAKRRRRHEKSEPAHTLQCYHSALTQHTTANGEGGQHNFLHVLHIFESFNLRAADCPTAHRRSAAMQSTKPTTTTTTTAVHGATRHRGLREQARFWSRSRRPFDKRVFKRNPLWRSLKKEEEQEGRRGVLQAGHLTFQYIIPLASHAPSGVVSANDHQRIKRLWRDAGTIAPPYTYIVLDQRRTTTYSN